ncbi:MAG: 3-deoxy-manno-octulosonate-8-phosphatase KdsC [Methylohalobius sp.]|nr:3-deoxy-manno-octulosonate-8-phosphatase KdsC [Methylohalobius sp.]
MYDPKVLERAAAIRVAIFDVDGVLTDGRLFFDHEGREYKAFHARDGYGLKLLAESGVETAVISGRISRSVALRCASLGIRHVYQGYEDKLAALSALQQTLEIETAHIAYVGDDLLDLPVMRRVHLAVAVQDAHFAVKKQAHWITEAAGGMGAAREVCDLILYAQGKFDRLLDRYLK